MVDITWQELIDDPDEANKAKKSAQERSMVNLRRICKKSDGDARGRTDQERNGDRTAWVGLGLMAFSATTFAVASVVPAVGNAGMAVAFLAGVGGFGAGFYGLTSSWASKFMTDASFVHSSKNMLKGAGMDNADAGKVINLYEDAQSHAREKKIPDLVKWNRKILVMFVGRWVKEKGSDGDIYGLKAIFADYKVDNLQNFQLQKMKDGVSDEKATSSKDPDLSEFYKTGTGLGSSANVVQAPKNQSDEVGRNPSVSQNVRD